MMEKNAKIYVAGHRGMVGGAILRQLTARKVAGEDITLLTRTHFNDFFGRHQHFTEFIFHTMDLDMLFQ